MADNTSEVVRELATFKSAGLWDRKTVMKTYMNLKMLYNMSKTSRKILEEKGTASMLGPILVLCCHACLKAHFNENSEELETKKVSEDDATHTDWLKVSVIAFRVARNICVESPKNQAELAQDYINDALVAFIVHLCTLKVQSEDVSTVKLCQQTAQAIGQALVNFVAGNEETQTGVWKKIFPKALLAMSKAQHIPRLNGIASGLLHTCIATSPERLSDLLSSEGVELVSSLIVSHFQCFDGIPQDPWVTSLQSLDKEFPELVWTLHTLTHIASSGIEKKKEVSFLSQTITYLLDGKENKEDKGIYDLKMGAAGIALVLLDVTQGEENEKAQEERYPLDLLELLALWIGDKSSVVQGRKEIWGHTTEKDTERIPHDTSLDFLYHASIRYITSGISKQSSVDIKKLAKTNGFIPSLKKQLASISGAKKIDGKLQFRQSAYRFRSDLINIFSTLAGSGDKTIQDLIAADGGLELIMSQTYIDLNNPLQREYSVLALRHLTKGNSKIQDAIRSIQLQEVSNTTELAEMGVRAVRKGVETKENQLDAKDPVLGGHVRVALDRRKDAKMAKK